MASEPYGRRPGARAAPLPPAATEGIRGDPADDLGPPVEPNLVRPREIPGARRVGRNTLEILVFRGLSTPLALGLVILQSRFLEPDGRGAYVVAVLGVTIVSRLLGQLGVAVSNRLRTEAGDTRGLVHRALALGIGGGLVAVPLIAAAGAGIGGIGLDVALVAAFALVPNVVWQSVSGVLLGQARVRLWNYVQLGSPVLTLAGMLVLVVSLDLGVLGAVTAWLVANIATAAFSLAAAHDLWLPLERPRLDGVARSLAWLAAGMGAVQVINLLSYRVELFILDRHAGLAEIGIYSVAMQAAEAMWLLPAAVANAVTAPAIHDEEPEAVRLVRRAALRALGLTAAVAAALGLAAPFVLPFLLGEAFGDAVRPLLLLLPGVVLYAPVSVLVVFLSVRHGRPRLSVVVSLVGMAVTLGLALVLIPRHGVAGAAVASAVGYAAGGALAWLFFARVARASLRRVA